MFSGGNSKVRPYLGLHCVTFYNFDIPETLLQKRVELRANSTFF
jgi:hypothetical protein